MGLMIMAATALVVIIIWTVHLPLMSKPLITDEVESVKVAIALNQTGKPVIKVGSDKEVMFHHSRIYHYLLAGVFRLLGNSEWQARLIGVFCYLINGLLVWGITRELESANNAGWAPLWATLFYLISPLAVQGSVLVDIETTVLTTGTMGFLYYVVATLARPKPFRSFITGLLWGACLMIKASTALLLGPLAIWVQYWRKRTQRPLMDVIQIIAIGLGVYLVFTFIYSTSHELNPLAPLLHKWSRILSGLGGEDANILISWTKRSLRLFMWLTPWALIIYLIAVRDSMRNLIHHKKVDGTSLLMVYTLIVLVGYIIIKGSGYGFPRYHLPMLPAMSVLIGLQVARVHLIPRQATLTLICVLLLGLYFGLLNTDFFYQVYTFGERMVLNPEGHDAAAVQLFQTTLLYIIPFLFALAVIAAIGLRRRLLWIVTATVVSLPLALSQIYIQKNRSYSTNYLYGESGHRDTAAYLAGIVGPNELIICPTDIAHYIGREQLYLSASKVFTKNRIALAVDDPRIRVIAFRDGFWNHVVFGRLLKELRPILDHSFENQRIGSFFIYVRKKDARKGHTL
jgi:4-amino-4-deoxy-L-arabinose transferase-like glycosyltransferase